MLTASLGRGGGGVFPALKGTADRLWQSGVAVHILGLGPGETADPRQTSVPLWGRATLGYAPGLGRALARSDPEIAHLHGLWTQPSVALLRWSRRWQRPAVISPHGMLDPWALARSPWKKRLASALFERANLGRAACLHALTTAEARSMRGFGLTNPIAVIPNGIDLPQIGTKPDTDRRELLFLGRLHPKKGLAETLCAWALLGRISPETARDWRLVIAGWDDGGYRSQLERLAADLGLGPDRLRFRGPVFGAAKTEAFLRAQAFVLASHSEGQPMAVLEAWAHSIAVFKTAACNLPQGFTAGAAIAVTPDPTTIARAFAEHLPRADLPEIGNRGRALAAAHFSWERAATAHAEIYRWLANGGPHPTSLEPT